MIGTKGVGRWGGWVGRCGVGGCERWVQVMERVNIDGREG